MQYRVGKSYFAHTVNLKLGLVFSRLVYRYIGRFESSYKVSMAYNLGLGPVYKHICAVLKRCVALAVGKHQPSHNGVTGDRKSVV